MLVHYWHLLEVWPCFSCSLTPIYYYFSVFLMRYIASSLKVKNGQWLTLYDKWNNQQWKIYLCNTSWVYNLWYMSPAKQANHPSSTSRAPVRLIQWWPALVHDNLDIRKIKQIIIKQGLERNLVIDVISNVLSMMSTESCRWISIPIEINIWSEVYINSPSNSLNPLKLHILHEKISSECGPK
jgi:hypothetical protein